MMLFLEKLLLVAPVLALGWWWSGRYTAKLDRRHEDEVAVLTLLSIAVTLSYTRLAQETAIPHRDLQRTLRHLTRRGLLVVRGFGVMTSSLISLSEAGTVAAARAWGDAAAAS